MDCLLFSKRERDDDRHNNNGTDTDAESVFKIIFLLLF